MRNCIFTGHCTEIQCDKSCPILAQTSYLLDRNEISMSSPVFTMGRSKRTKYLSLLEKAQGRIATVVDSGVTTLTADALTYLSICDNWKGSQLHCTVYNLKFSKYLDMLQKSWGYGGDTSELDYVKIWIASAKVLVISSIDFINFKDFQSQTLLSLLQSRMQTGMTTIVVSPPISSLVGDGQFFARLTDILSKQKVGACSE